MAAQLGYALDVAKTHWYHLTAIVIAAMGLFTDVYDLFSISPVTKLLDCIYYYIKCSTKLGSLPFRVASSINGVTHMFVKIYDSAL
ncbi:inorganic phosphate transporter 1-5 [Tripterygium wilfordii]|uniref:Inorganic phosphate transporter 1-5 n=1 Tax=Tripterygium wilfordii TaxID=458696 RepID=A0A7J7DSF5_TRIWF|nr:inorganic phosphate transporter 1-5 [Tripterygium wilfordii]